MVDSKTCPLCDELDATQGTRAAASPPVLDSGGGSRSGTASLNVGVFCMCCSLLK